MAGDMIWYHFDNVLWISTRSKDRITHRKALGIISIDARADHSEGETLFLDECHLEITTEIGSM